jgi:lipopolysaccharide biosynthesis glycosyltransferase
MEEINILTSCDSRLAEHIFTQLKNISDNLVPLYEVHFWLFHYRIEKADIDGLTSYADFLGIKFHEVFVSDHEDYKVLSKGTNDSFPIECYFYFLAHKYLPESMDRALYIDAGDVIFDGDINEYYFAPFEGNFLIASMAHSLQKALYTFDDLSRKEAELNIVHEYVNSGSLMLNLQLMRLWDINMKFYERIVDYLIALGYSYTADGIDTPIYYYFDQGLLAASHVGHIKFWDYAKYGYNGLRFPYNFKPKTFEFNRKRFNIPADGEMGLVYVPKIIHLCGIKPWTVSPEEYLKLLPISKKYLDMFWEAEREVSLWRKNLGRK